MKVNWKEKGRLNFKAQPGLPPAKALAIPETVKLRPEK